MGRHNTVAGRMAKSSEARGRLFTKLARELMVAARGGSDPDTNAALRSAIEKARDNSMTKEGIDRAVKKGAGELASGAAYEEIVYEGYGPGGGAILVSVLTDNRNRTYPEIRRLFQKHHGNLGEVGSVAWMFKKQGVFTILASATTEESLLDIALQGGADDVILDNDHFIVLCPVENFAQVRQKLQSSGLTFEKAGLEFLPENTLALANEDDQKNVLDLLEKLDEQDDVQAIAHNYEL